MVSNLKSDFVRGILHGFPIALGYLSVSFGFGITAVASGLSVGEASAISASNVTSAGQAAGVDIIAAGGTIIEMILVQLTINIRYSLMGISLSQKLDKSFTLPHRLIASFGITDEIFAVCSAQPKPLTPFYMYGMILIAIIGWVLGTFLGASAGQLLPAAVSSALGIVLYGMFLALIVPAMKDSIPVTIVVLISIGVHTLFTYVPLFNVMSTGVRLISATLIATCMGAWLFPREDEA